MHKKKKRKEKQLKYIIKIIMFPEKFSKTYLKNN